MTPAGCPLSAPASGARTARAAPCRDRAPHPLCLLQAMKGSARFVFCRLSGAGGGDPGRYAAAAVADARWRPTIGRTLISRCYAQLSGWIDLAPDGQAEDHPALPDAGSDAADPRPGAPTAQDIFGYDEFRPSRKRSSPALNGRDTLAIMPTGSGKSVCDPGAPA